MGRVELRQIGGPGSVLNGTPGAPERFKLYSNCLPLVLSGGMSCGVWALSLGFRTKDTWRWSSDRWWHGDKEAVPQEAHVFAYVGIMFFFLFW